MCNIIKNIRNLHASPMQLVRIWVDNSWAHVRQKFASPLSRTEVNVSGKVVVITGANSGIGKCTALEMAKRGAIVVMGCRDLIAGEKAKIEISEAAKSISVELYYLDLSDTESITKFAEQVVEHHPVIDILVNNAGVLINSSERKFTKQGFEMHMGVNHLGHFLLTKLLIESVSKSDIRRIVNLSSTACVWSNLSTEDLMLEKSKDLGVRNLRPYNNSKFANALFTKELAKQMEKHGIRVYAVCPGLVSTRIFREYETTGFWKFARVAFAFSVPVERATEAVLHCSISKEVENDSGGYFRFGKRIRIIEKLFSDDLAVRLWETSEMLVGSRGQRIVDVIYIV